MKRLWIACIATSVFAATVAEPPTTEAIAHYTKGVQHKQAQRLNEAVAELTAAVNLSPDFLDAHWVLAWTYSALKQTDAAVTHFNEVIRIDPQGDKAAEARRTIERLGGEVKEPPPLPPAEPDKPPEPPKPAPPAEEKQPTKPPEEKAPPPAPPEDDTPAPDDVVWIDRFEDDVTHWWDWEARRQPTLVPDEAHVKNGKFSGKWDMDNAARQVGLAQRYLLGDWTGLDSFCFWCYSERATGTKFAIAIYSLTDEPGEKAWYTQVVEVNWEGWRLFELPLWSFRRSKEPFGWERIDSILFAVGGTWDTWVRHVPGTVLYFDDMYLANTLDPDRLIIHDPDIMENFWPLTPTSDLPREGRQRSVPWLDTVGQGYTANIGIPPDWSDYRFLHLWIHSATANNAPLAIKVHSENELTDDQDYFNLRKFKLNWEGWKELTFDLRQAVEHRQPVGYNAVTRLEILAKGMGVGPFPSTKLHLGEVWLTKEKEPE